MSLTERKRILITWVAWLCMVRGEVGCHMCYLLRLWFKLNQISTQSRRMFWNQVAPSHQRAICEKINQDHVAERDLLSVLAHDEPCSRPRATSCLSPSAINPQGLFQSQIAERKHSVVWLADFRTQAHAFEKLFGFWSTSTKRLVENPSFHVR
jgi:hypothetical protein